MMSYDYKHLTLDQRMDIQLGLKAGMTLNDLSERIHKSPRTISMEIKLHLERKQNQKYQFNNSEKRVCNQHQRYPYVCDGCPFKTHCMSDSFSYDAKMADKAYRRTLSSARHNIHLTPDEFVRVDTLIKDGVSRGLSPAHVVASHPEMPIGERSIYRYIDRGIMSIENYKLRNKVGMRKRHKKSSEPLDKGIYAGRTFIDYLAYIHQHPGMFTAQMDTVIGLRSDRKMVLTFILIELHLFYAFIVPKGIAGVIKGVNQLESMLGPTDFRRLFSVILTDRGTEFTNPDDIEKDFKGEKRTRVFYCDPLASYQKGAIESIHRVLRYVLPKSKSVDFLTQPKLEKLMSGINNYRLRSNQFRTAYELVKVSFGEEVLVKLKIEALDPDSIHLTPDLVK
jgi:IS30 family transposase